MRILIITQDEPFFLKDNLKYLFEIIMPKYDVVGCVVNDVSPFGKKESFLKKCYKTFNIFGLRFFLYYSFLFVKSILFSSSVINLLSKNNIPLIKLNRNINHKDSVELIKSYKPDLLVSILGNQIFKEQIFNLAKFGCINLHTALLPKYRGLMPTFWVLKNNEDYTGVSVFFVDSGIDSGPIIVQKKVLISNQSQQELIKLTKKMGMEAIAEAIDLINSGKYTLIENNPDHKTYFSFPTKKDVKEFRASGKTFF